MRIYLSQTEVLNVCCLTCATFVRCTELLYKVVKKKKKKKFGALCLMCLVDRISFVTVTLALALSLEKLVHFPL